MFNPRKILVPIDGSEPAWRALEFAIRMVSGAPDGAVHVLYVHPRIDVAGKVQIFVSEQHMRELAMKESRWLMDAANRTAAAPLQAGTRPRSSKDGPAEVIARRAQELGCETIVMGTRGMGRMANLVMGSVATRVVQLTQTPVTLIK